MVSQLEILEQKIHEAFEVAGCVSYSRDGGEKDEVLTFGILAPVGERGLLLYGCLTK